MRDGTKLATWLIAAWDKAQRLVHPGLRADGTDGWVTGLALSIADGVSAALLLG